MHLWRPHQEAADRIAAAVADPVSEPPLAVLLEALPGAHRDDETRALESAQTKFVYIKAPPFC